MTLKAKAITVCCIALLGAVVASGSAQGGVFKADRYPATVTTSQRVGNHVWELGALRITCSGPRVDGQLWGPSSTLTFTINFATCSNPYGSVSADFSPCDFRAYLGETIIGSGGRFRTILELSCASKWITFKLLGCEIRVPTQGSLEPVSAYNSSLYYEEYEYGVVLEAGTPLKYQIMSAASCFLTPGVYSNGRYTGAYRLSGEPLTGYGEIRIYGAHY